MSEKSRYVTKASLRHITMERQCLRWWMTARPCIHPLRYLERERTEGRKREKFYICLDVTHTHTPGQSRVNPERQEEEKGGHTTGRRPKPAQGGEGNRRTSGTNLHGETDLTKTAHAPKPHDTLRRGTRGKLGTKWGTSW